MSSGTRHAPRELYIDAFRGVMALLMVQGHVCEALLTPAARGDALYRWQMIVHGSTAPGFLFASGFVAGLPRAPLSLRASVRRARRLLFILGVGYALDLPYFSFWKTLAASPAERAALLACNALHVIAVTQLGVLVLQWLAGRRWVGAAGLLGLAILAAGPGVWSSQVSTTLPEWLAPYVDARTGSLFPVFPYAAFVLAGTVAGAAVGRQEPQTRRRRAVRGGAGLVGLGLVVSALLAGRVDFWSISPGYALMRIGGLLLLLRLVEAAAVSEWPLMPSLALVGHETLLVYCLHLVLLFGGVVFQAPLAPWLGRLGFGATALVLLGMVPVLYAAAFVWHRAKARWPRGATLVLSGASAVFVYEYFTRPW